MFPSRDCSQYGCGFPEATPCTYVVRQPLQAHSAEGRPPSDYCAGVCPSDTLVCTLVRGSPRTSSHSPGPAVSVGAGDRGRATSSPVLEESRRRSPQRRAGVAGGGCPDVAERPRSLMDPHQAAWKDARGEKHTGGWRWSQGASQRPWRLPQRRLLGRVIAIIRLVPCGQGACGVTFPGSRCKSCVWPVLCWACVPALPRLTSQALHKRSPPPVVHRESLARHTSV